MENFNRLLALSPDELDQAYALAQPGEIPAGSSKGTAIFFPGFPMLNTLMAKVAHCFWGGKVFDAGDASLKNKVLGALRLFKARVYKGESYFDGRESIIIDYADTSLVCQRVRDEIRQVGPGLYLGKAFIRQDTGKGFVAVHFALDFN